MREEMDVDVDVGRLLWVMEHFFTHAGRPFHEVAFYYQMRLPVDSPYLDVRQDFIGSEGQTRLLFRWFPIAQLAGVRFYPTFFRTALADLPETPQHIVQFQLDDGVSTH